MLMSQAARSADDTASPSFGASAAIAAGAANSATINARRSSENIGGLSFLVDAPTCDRVEVVDAAQSTLGDELRARRLHHAGLIGRAALQHDRATAPLPRHAKAGDGLGQHRLLQCGWRP